MMRYWRIVRAQRRPVKFVLSRLLMRLGLSRWWTIRQAGFRLRFFPTSLSAALWIDPTDHQAEADFLRRYLRAGDVVVDVGANIGLTTLAAARAVGATGRVVAIEPHPRIFRYLQENVRLNAFANVTLLNVACGADETRVPFSDLRADDHNYVGPAGDWIEVPLGRLDELVADLGQVTLLKIDVEGYEMRVLQGARQLLDRTECVHFESWDEHFARYGYRSPDVFALLAEHGFGVYRLVAGQDPEPIPAGYHSGELEHLVAHRSWEGLRARLA